MQQRHSDLAHLGALLALPYLEDQRRDDPEPYRLIGFVGGRLVTCIIEYREDENGAYMWVVTAWHATVQEERAYERATRER